MKPLAPSVLVLALLAGNARADVVISKAATRNMSCSAGVCTSTAKKAVLNKADLANMLASGDVTVATGNGAVTIAVAATFSWTSASRLTLNAQDSVNIRAPMVVAGPGAVTVTTGAGGDLAFLSGGRADFWDTSSSLIVNGTAYTLVGDIHGLAAAITADPSGSFALAANYDASADGTYKQEAVPDLMGNFDGLGHTIDKFSITGKKDFQGIALFAGLNGTIRDIHLTRVKVRNTGFGNNSFVGGLVTGTSAAAMIVRASVGGSVKAGAGSFAGGVVAYNQGTVSLCSANVSVTGRIAGGVAGANDGLVSQSWAAGSVQGLVWSSQDMLVGGLVGWGGTDNDARIVQSYATASVVQPNDTGDTGSAGGLAGFFGNFNTTSISESYSTGAVSGFGDVGGFIGRDNTAGGMSKDYWDVDTSGVSRGAGGIDDHGIKGLTTAQFQSGLPARFDRKVWAESPDVNNGYPYLIDNPPN